MAPHFASLAKMRKLIKSFRSKSKKRTPAPEPIDYSSNPATYPKAALLSIPAEIRNRIYDFALSEDLIDITTAIPAQPALKPVNRQRREESLTAYYRQNAFKCTSTDYDRTQNLRFAFIPQSHGIKVRDRLKVQLNAPNFAQRNTAKQHLMKWARDYFHAPEPGFA
jgi:hypothetical protein